MSLKLREKKYYRMLIENYSNSLDIHKTHTIYSIVVLVDKKNNLDKNKQHEVE